MDKLDWWKFHRGIIDAPKGKKPAPISFQVLEGITGKVLYDGSNARLAHYIKKINNHSTIKYIY